jgi:hypothetical protein
MNKKTKIVLGVAALGAVAYYLWKKSKTTSAFANQVGGNIQPIFMPQGATCVGYAYTCPDGRNYCEKNYYNNSIPMTEKFKCPTTTTKAAVLTKQQTQRVGRTSGN